MGRLLIETMITHLFEEKGTLAQELKEWDTSLEKTLVSVSGRNMRRQSKKQ